MEEQHVDLYQFTASKIFNVPYDEVTPEQRLFAKKRMYFTMYSTPKLLDCEDIRNAFK